MATVQFRPDGKVYARSITASTVAARQPVGFAGGGNAARIYNAGTTSVLVAFYNYAVAGADPTLTFPADAAPPVGQSGILVGPGQEVIVTANGVGTSDSFAAIGSAAGPSLIYVQKGSTF